MTLEMSNIIAHLGSAPGQRPFQEWPEINILD